MTGRWTPHDTRDSIVDFVREWSEKTELAAERFVGWIGITRGWEIREAMTESDVECILQRAREAYPDERPRIISDNGPQFVAKDFKEFIRLTGMTHVRTSPYYPQSNGKIERWHKTLKGDAIRPGQPDSLDQARVVVARFVEHYNTVRLHSAIGYIAAGRLPRRACRGNLGGPRCEARSRA